MLYITFNEDEAEAIIEFISDNLPSCITEDNKKSMDNIVALSSIYQKVFNELKKE